MHSVNIHIDETIDRGQMGSLCRELMTAPHVSNVELHEGNPHDMLVEYEEHHDMPMHLLQVLQQRGLHADIVGC
jgi:hypothetical protein